MARTFNPPDFSQGLIEFRMDGDEVALYATAEGLRWLAQKCLVLAEAGKSDHLHLADYQVLTIASTPATLAIFPS